MENLEKKIVKCFLKLGIKKKETVFLSGNIGMFGFPINHKLLNIFYRAILDVIGKEGTLVFPTHTFSLVKKKKIFDLKKTKCETGIFSEFLRKKKNTIRQLHPFSSCAAIGKNAKYICSNNTEHVYGPNSPWARMISLKTKYISYGLKPNYACPQVHHAELMMNVPYRSFSKYEQKVKINNKLIKKTFYLFNLKNKFQNIKRTKNKKIFKNFIKTNNILETKLGVGKIYSYSLKRFYQSNIELLKKDIFCWMK